MSDLFKIGDSKEIQIIVTDEMTAKSMHSGSLEVFSTPVMISFMESVSFDILEENLPDDQTSVGTKVDIRHLAPTSVGTQVIVNATIIEIRGNSITFDVEAKTCKGVIGKGTHRRGIVVTEDFMRIALE